MIYCRCLDNYRYGFICTSGWCLCGKCRLPTKLFLEAKMKEDEVPLVLFEGGPLDQYVYETATLLQEDQPVPHVEQYKWTSERRRSESTGAVAQVWRHESLYEIGDDNVSDAPPLPTQQSPSLTPARNAAVSELSDAVTAAHRPDAASGATLSGDASDVVDVPASAPTEVATPVSTGNVDPAIRGETLTARRKKLKWSREKAGTMAGLAVSRIWALDTGKRTKNDAEDYAKYDAALTLVERGGDAGGRV